MTDNNSYEFNQFPAELIAAITSLAEKPTNNDLTIRHFYEAVKKKIDAADRLKTVFRQNTRDRFIHSLDEVVQERLSETSPDSIAKALFQFYQFTNWYRNGYQDHLDTPNFFTTPPDYMNIRDHLGWQHQLMVDFADDIYTHQPSQFREFWTQSMKVDHIPTTIAQRYAGIRAIYTQRFGDKPITIADIGCGTGIGLERLQTNSPFEELEHDGTNGTVTSLMGSKLNIERAIGIDLQDFTQPRARLLALACRYSPSEFYRIAGDLTAELSIRAESRSRGNIEFRQGNFLTDNILQEPVDAISIPTVLYQIKNQAARQEFVEEAKSHLKPNGIVVLQDFAIKDPNNPENPLGLEFGQPWDKYFSYVYTKEDSRVVPPQQIFVWAGGRCRSVEQGEDFTKFFRQGYSGSAIAA